MEFLECDDMSDEYGLCLGDMDYCSSLRRSCKKADDFYHKQDGNHYYQRFVIYKKREKDEETGERKTVYYLRDLHNKFKPLPLKNKNDAKSLIYYLYKLVDTIDDLGGHSESIKI